MTRIASELPLFYVLPNADARTGTSIGTIRQTHPSGETHELVLGGRIGRPAGYPSRSEALDVLKSLPAAAVIRRGDVFLPYLLDGPGADLLRTDAPEMVLPDPAVDAVLQSGRHLWLRENSSAETEYDRRYQQFNFGRIPDGDDTFLYDSAIVPTEVPFGAALDTWARDATQDVLANWRLPDGSRHRLAIGDMAANRFGYASFEDAHAAAMSVGGDTAVVCRSRKDRWYVVGVKDLDGPTAEYVGTPFPVIERAAPSAFVELIHDGDVIARGDAQPYKRREMRPAQPYATWRTPVPEGGLTNLDLVMTPTDDPPVGSAYYASHQFGLAHGAGGYIGMQQTGHGKQVIFSIWNAISGSSPGTARPFGGEGVGYQTFRPYEWQAGHSYQFRVWQNPPDENGSLVLGFVKDLTTGGPSQQIGAIRLKPGRGSLRPTSYNWIEYYGPTRNSASDYPRFGVTFGRPTGNVGAVEGASIGTRTGADTVPSSSVVAPDGSSVHMEINAS